MTAADPATAPTRRGRGPVRRGVAPGALALVVRVLFVLNSFVIGVVLTRLLDPSGVGSWFAVIAASTLATAVLGQGLPFGVSRSIAADPSARRAVVVRATLRTMLTWLLAALVGATVCAVLGLGLGDIGSSSLVVVAAALILAGPQTIERIVTEAGRGARIDPIGLLGDGVFSRTLFTLVALVVLLVGFRPGVPTLLFVYAGAVVAFVVVALVALRRVTYRTLEHGAGQGTDKVFTRSLWAHSITVAFMAQGDLFLASLLLRSDQVANYGVAWRVGSIVSLPLVAIGSTMTGRIYTSIRHGRGDDLLNEMAAPMRRAVGVAAAVFLLLAVFGVMGLGRVFGRAYEDAFVPMMIIAGGQVISVWAGPVGHVLIGAGRDRALVAATGGSALALVVLVPVGAGLFGESGVAIAMTVSLAVAALVRNYFAQQVLGGRGCGTIWRFSVPRRSAPPAVRPASS